MCRELHRQSIGENATLGTQPGDEAHFDADVLVNEEVDPVRADQVFRRESSKRVRTGEPDFQDRGEPLPDHPHGIRLKGSIRRDDRKSAHERLSDQHAVEGISVEHLELLSREGVGFGEGQTRDARFFANRGDQRRGMRRQGDSAPRVLAGNLPD